MAAEIELGGVRAIVEGGQWQCSDPQLLKALQLIQPEGGVGGEIANPDKWLALRACEILGGIFISSEPTQSVPGSVH